LKKQVKAQDKGKEFLNLNLDLNLPLEYHRLENEALLRTGPATCLAADAVAGIGDLHEHLGGIVFIQLFKGQYVMNTNLVTAAAADAGLFVQRFDEFRGVLCLVSSQAGNVSHDYFLQLVKC
jgi:hypothetical protein